MKLWNFFNYNIYKLKDKNVIINILFYLFNNGELSFLKNFNKIYLVDKKHLVDM